MTIEQLKGKIAAVERALKFPALPNNNAELIGILQENLVELQAKLIQGLEARVEIAKSDESAFREAFEEVGHGVCDSCDGPLFAEEGHATFGGEQEICDGCYESAIGNV